MYASAAAKSCSRTDSYDLGRKMMRQVAGAFAEYEKGRLIAKLRSGRERKRKETGKKVGGRIQPGVQTQSP